MKKKIKVGLKLHKFTILISAGLLGLSVLLMSSTGSAADIYKIIVEKQKKKKSSRWTLAEWLALKERNRAMDMWLAMNSSVSPYEFYLGWQEGAMDFEQSSSGSSTTTSWQLRRYTLGAFATIAGIHGEYEMRGPEQTALSASFRLRLWGMAVQNSHFVLEYGQQKRKEPISGNVENIVAPFAGSSLSFYLTKHFGIAGYYRRFFNGSTDSGGSWQGSSWRGQVFLDFGILRLYGEWLQEKVTFESAAAVESRFDEQGVLAGLQLFF